MKIISLKTLPFMGGVCASLLLSFSSQAAESLITQAQQCTQLTSRLERLGCFDNVFKTSIVEASYPKETRPRTWFIATKSESKREEGDISSLVSSDLEAPKNRWLTIPDANNREVILRISCIDNISRIEMVLPEATREARINFTIAKLGEFIWRADDSGYLLEGARGIPAINLMEKIMELNQVKISSNSKRLNGLEFNTQNLHSSIQPLRESCRW